MKHQLLVSLSHSRERVRSWSQTGAFFTYRRFLDRREPVSRSASIQPDIPCLALFHRFRSVSRPVRKAVV